MCCLLCFFYLQDLHRQYLLYSIYFEDKNCLPQSTQLYVIILLIVDLLIFLIVSSLCYLELAHDLEQNLPVPNFSNIIFPQCSHKCCSALHNSSYSALLDSVFANIVFDLYFNYFCLIISYSYKLPYYLI